MHSVPQRAAACRGTVRHGQRERVTQPPIGVRHTRTGTLSLLCLVGEENPARFRRMGPPKTRKVDDPERASAEVYRPPTRGPLTRPAIPAHQRHADASALVAPDAGALRCERRVSGGLNATETLPNISGSYSIVELFNAEKQSTTAPTAAEATGKPLRMASHLRGFRDAAKTSPRVLPPRPPRAPADSTRKAASVWAKAPEVFEALAAGLPPAVSRPLDAESVGWRSQRTRRENANGCAWLRATAATDSGTRIQAWERKWPE